MVKLLKLLLLLISMLVVEALLKDDVSSCSNSMFRNSRTYEPYDTYEVQIVLIPG